MPRYGTVDMDYAAHLGTCPPDEDGPVLMVNLMKYRDRAEYRDGADHGRSGREADDEYAPVEVLADIGAVVAFHGDVVDGSASSGWDRVGIVQYPTRRAFIEMQSRRDFRDKHTHKEAGMERTIVFAVPPNAVAVGTAVVRADQVVFDLVRRAGEPRLPGPAQAVGAVEGTILGDGRRWTELRVTWGDTPALDAVDDRERVVVRPAVDRLPRLLGTEA
jgi:hypothetical protein